MTPGDDVTDEWRRYTVELGQRLARLREARGYSKNRAAARAGIRRPRLWQYEMGRVLPKLPALERIARAYGVSVEEIL